MTHQTSITLNGSPLPIDGPTPLHILLDRVGLSSKPVVVELNAQAISPRDYPNTLVEAGARVEIVTLAAGG